MKKIVISFFALFFITGCFYTDAIDTDKLNEEGKIEVRIKVRKSNPSLQWTIEDLNKFYGKPTVELSAFRLENNETIILKKLYYQIDKKTFVIVSIIDNEVQFIDTIHAPNVPDNKQQLLKGE